MEYEGTAQRIYRHNGQVITACLVWAEKRGFKAVKGSRILEKVENPKQLNIDPNLAIMFSFDCENPVGPTCYDICDRTYILSGAPVIEHNS